MIRGSPGPEIDIVSRIELGYSYELGSGWTRIGVLTRPRKRSGTVMTTTHTAASDQAKAMAVFSHLEGPRAGRYAQVRLDECMATNTWPMWADLQTEIENFFLLGNNQEWARSQLLCLRQGPRQRIDNFLAQFQALKVQSACPNEYAKDLLERAVQRKVLEQVYMRGLPRETWEQVVGAVCTVERAQELFLINTSTPTRYFSTNNYTTSSGTPSGSGAPMDIGAANTRPQRGKGIQCSFLHNLFRALRDFVPNMLADEAGRARALRIMGRIFGRILVGFVIIRKGSLGTKGLPINRRKR